MASTVEVDLLREMSATIAPRLVIGLLNVPMVTGAINATSAEKEVTRKEIVRDTPNLPHQGQ